MVSIKQRLASRMKLATLLGIVVILVGVFSLATPYFLSMKNFINVIVHSSILAMLAIGMTFVIISGGLDLSVGSAIAFAGVLGVLAFQGSGSVALGLAVCVLSGCALGVLNGLLIGYLGINAFIATIATLAIYRGATLMITGGRTISIVSRAFNYLGQAQILKVPVIIPLLVILYVLFHFVLRRTVFGRSVYAIGGNALAARVSGIRVRVMTLAVYALSGTLAGICAIFVIGRLSSLQPWAGQGADFETIVAIVLGGINIAGGEGDLLESLAGVLIIAIILNALNLIQAINPFYHYVVKGAIIIGAIGIYERLKKYGSA
jgi:ribose/xylose/arabinose/galactoside ABC-type transport system permease subunit